MAKRKLQNRTAARNGDASLRVGDVTTLGDEITRGLGEITLVHPLGTTPITPASMISVEAIAGHGHLLEGVGIDWGSGGGCLSVMAARTSGVTRVVGLEIDETNVSVARRNARLNGVEEIGRVPAVGLIFAVRGWRQAYSRIAQRPRGFPDRQPDFERR